MIRLASLFQPRKQIRRADLSVPALPYVFVLRLGSNPGETPDASEPSIILDALQPWGRIFFLECPESLAGLDLFPWMERLDKHGLRYHLGIPAIDSEPRPFLRRLQGLVHLDRLRIFVRNTFSFEDDRDGIFLRLAVASGMKVWIVAPLASSAAVDLEPMVRRACAMGVKGLSFSLPMDTNPPDLSSRIQILSDLHGQGYPAYMEGCMPVEHSPFTPLRGDGCTKSGAHLLVDQAGILCTCPHDVNSFGDLRQHSLEEIWHRLPGHFGTEEIEPGQADRTVHFDGDLCPFARFGIREDPSGALLYRGYDHLHVTGPGLRIVRTFDGTIPLRKIRKRFGEESLSLVYALFTKGMIRFVRREGTHG